jgi:protein SCO1/2
MTKTSTVSTQKIVTLLVFICVAIMTFSFLYQIHQQRMNATKPLIAQEVGLVLPAPRELNSFKLVANTQPFTLSNLYQHWTLLLFGFTHCSNVCPATLNTLKPVYENLKKSYPSLQVVMVSIDPERDTAHAIAQYARSFNTDFIGVTGKQSDIHKLQAELGIYSARDPQSSHDNYQVLHTASIMLINPSGQWVALYRPDNTAQQLTDSINTTIKDLLSRA